MDALLFSSYDDTESTSIIIPAYVHEELHLHLVDDQCCFFLVLLFVAISSLACFTCSRRNAEIVSTSPHTIVVADRVDDALVQEKNEKC